MDKKNCGDYEVTCSSCGRPWAICKEKGGCSKCGDVRFCEYGRKASGCIREKQPGCPMQAVIPSVTVDTVNGIKGLSDCLVHVADINTTYYIDDQHRLLTTWGGPVSVYDYDFDDNPLNLRNQMAYDTANNILAIYDKSGIAYKVPISDLDNDYNIMVNKPQINGYELIGNKTGDELGLQGELTAGDNIQIEGNTISATDTTYTAGDGIELDESEFSLDDDYLYSIEYPSPSVSLTRIYREIIDDNNSKLSTYIPGVNGASGVQGGVSTGQNTMIFTYWNGDDASLNENKIIEKDISTGAILKEVSGNYGWCNGLAYNPDAGLVYVIPRGKIENGSNVNLKQIVVLRYSDLSFVETITLNTDKTIQSACYENGELWVMAEGGKKFYQIDTSTYSVLKTVNVDIPQTNSAFYYQNFSYCDGKFWILGSLPRALMVYSSDGSLFRQYTMPTGANNLYNVGEYQFIDNIEGKKFLIGSSQGVGTAHLNQVFLMDLSAGLVDELRYNGTPTNPDVKLDLYIDSSATNVNPDGTIDNPFKEIFEATLIPNRHLPVRMHVASGQYKHVNLRGAYHYSIDSISGNQDYTINGLHLRECTDFLMFNGNIADSIIVSESASFIVRNSSANVRTTSIVSSSSGKYAVYLSEGARLGIRRSSSASSIDTPNVYVDATSSFSCEQSLGISARKSAGSSIIEFPVPLFVSNADRYYGDFAFDAVSSSWFDRSYYKFIYIAYTFRGTSKISKFLTTNNQPCLTESYIDGSGNSFIGKCYVSVNNEKISLSNNNFVKIANNSGDAAISITKLTDNESGNSNFFSIRNVYVSDN